jgi:WD40 repeat protein/serine/threonine protein kinase
MVNRCYEKGDIIAARGGSRDFKVLQVLGVGGLAKVYKVWDSLSQGIFALKVFDKRSDDDDLRLLRQEFNTLKEVARLCMHLPLVYNIGQLNDPELSYYLNMEYIEGQNLTNLITSGVSLREAYPIIAQLLVSISCLHKHEWLHRDIKPDNIIITPEGKVVLVDFNVSRRLEGERNTLVGTPDYIPPEITLRLGTWQYCCDLYSVGVVLYELLTGYNPFNETNVIPNLDRRASHNPKEINPEISDTLAEVTLKAIAYRSEERFQSAEEMLQALKMADWGFELTEEIISVLPDSLKNKIENRPDEPVQTSDPELHPIDPQHKIEQLPLIFTAPKLSEAFVVRHEETERGIELLLPSEGTSTMITALVGGGGFGKTTLAQAICHEKRVKKAFTDGILWVTIGETPNVVELLSNLIKLLAPSEISYSDVNAASARLRGLLKGGRAQKRLLLVLDDVWRESDVIHFIDAYPTGAHIITTRLQDVSTWSVPCRVQVIEVHEMTTDQATRLLINWLRPVPRFFLQAEGKQLLGALAQKLGEWPLLLELVGAQLRDYVLRHQKSLSDAIAIVYKRLEKRGLKAFNRANEQARNRAIHISFELSLQQLDEHCGALLNERLTWRKRYLELAIFPEYLDIPFSVICKLWQKTADFDEWESEEALFAMQRLSLFTRYDPNAQTVRLHHVIRALIASKQAINPLHGQLIDAYGPFSEWREDQPYMWHNLAYHLTEAGHNQLGTLLLNFAWLQAKLNVTDINALLADYKYLSRSKVVQEVRRMLGQAAYVLTDDKKQLASQLWGRLADEKTQLIRTLLQQTSDMSDSVWLRPFTSSLREHPAVIRNLIGPKSEVNAVVFSPDGRFLVCGFKDGTVQVWNFESGEIYLTLTSHTYGVNQVIVSPDGRHIISVSDDKNIKIWDLKSGQEKQTLEGHAKEVSGVAITHDGRFLISWSRDKTLKVWDFERDQVSLIFTHHTEVVNQVAVTHKHWIISASDDSTLQVLDLKSQKVRQTLSSHTGQVNSVIITNDERWVISGSNDSTLKVWNLESGKIHHTLTGHNDRVNSVTLSPNERWIISDSADQTLKVWGFDSEELYHTFEGHSASIRKVATTPGGDFIVSASDEELKVWDFAKKQEHLTLTGHTREMTGVIISPDGQYLISTAKERIIKVWDFRKIQALEAHIGHTGEITALIIDPSGYCVISASKDGTLKVWSIKNGEEQATLKSHIAAIDDIAMSSDGCSLLSVSQDRTVRVWNIEEERVLEILTVKDIGIVEIELDLEEGLFFSIFDDGTLKMSELEGLQKQKHALRVSGLAMSTNRNFFVSASQDTTLKVWNLDSGKVQQTLIGHTAAVNAVIMTGDKSLIVSASADKTLKVWDIHSGQVQRSLEGHTGKVNAVAMNPDGRFLVSASEDRTLKVWDFESGQIWQTLEGHGWDVKAVAISHDGRLIISASQDRTVRVWNFQSGECITKCHLNEPLNTCAITPDGRTIVAGGVSGRVHFLRLENYY